MHIFQEEDGLDSGLCFCSDYVDRRFPTPINPKKEKEKRGFPLQDDY